LVIFYACISLGYSLYGSGGSHREFGLGRKEQIKERGGAWEQEGRD